MNFKVLFWRLGKYVANYAQETMWKCVNVNARKHYVITALDLCAFYDKLNVDIYDCKCLKEKDNEIILLALHYRNAWACLEYASDLVNSCYDIYTWWRMVGLLANRKIKELEK